MLKSATSTSRTKVSNQTSNASPPTPTTVVRPDQEKLALNKRSVIVPTGKLDGTLRGEQLAVNATALSKRPVAEPTRDKEPLKLEPLRVSGIDLRRLNGPPPRDVRREPLRAPTAVVETASGPPSPQMQVRSAMSPSVSPSPSPPPAIVSRSPNSSPVPVAPKPLRSPVRLASPAATGLADSLTERAMDDARTPDSRPGLGADVSEDLPRQSHEDSSRMRLSGGALSVDEPASPERQPSPSPVDVAGSPVHRASETTGLAPAPMGPPVSEDENVLQTMITVQSEYHSLAALVEVKEATRRLFAQWTPLVPRKLAYRDEDGNFLLYWAALLGQVECVRLLLKRGSKITDKNNASRTALHAACSKATVQHAMSTELLLLHGANANAKDINNQTPLHFAVTRGRGMIARSPQNLNAVNLLTRWRADANVRDRLAQRTPLHYAAETGQVQVCNILIEIGKASFDLKDGNELTPLHLAAMHGHVACTHLFLLRGANIGALTRDGSTAVHLACRYRRPQVVALLLSAVHTSPRLGSLLLKQDQRGFTCVHWSALLGDLETLRVFGDQLPADIRDKIGFAPFHWAVLKSHRPSIHYLLSRGVMLPHADLDEPDSTVLMPMAGDFERAMLAPEYSDIQVEVEGKVFLCHKVVLARCLRKFLQELPAAAAPASPLGGTPLSRPGSASTVMVSQTPPASARSLSAGGSRTGSASGIRAGLPSEDSKPVQRLKITNMTKDTFQQFCMYLYTGRIPSCDEPDRLRALLKVANEYGLPVLRQTCENELLNRDASLVQNRMSMLPVHLAAMLDKGQYADCQMVVQEKVFRLHRVVLAARSAHFRSLLRAHKASGASAEEPIELHDEFLTKLVFQAVIDFLYTDSIRHLDQLHDEDLVLVCKAGRAYGLKRLAKKCEYYMFERLDDDTVVALFRMADAADLPTLRRACMDAMGDALNVPFKDTLTASQVAEIKKRAKEYAKELASADRNRKRTTDFPKRDKLNALAKSQPALPTVRPSSSESFTTIEAPASTPATRETVIVPRNRSNSVDAGMINLPRASGAAQPMMGPATTSNNGSMSARSSVDRRNSSTW
eukprot:TRINITY_DN7427_c0_g1_i4.p1 TRINITY_DN7427_c0_g1~~TRINITY_DN7427_c0_g1_i4.p1  ORF type:complete len:1077 (+),score=313.19 TRINITY_DN7427_c0_g1_i4:190-3420(+)